MIDPLARARDIESRILDRIEIGYRRKRRRVIVAADGELVKLAAPLRYRFDAGGVRVVIPEAGGR